MSEPFEPETEKLPPTGAAPKKPVTPPNRIALFGFPEPATPADQDDAEAGDAEGEAEGKVA